MCCFDSSKQHDNDLYELVEFNVKRVYKSAIRAREIGELLSEPRLVTDEELERRLAKLSE